MLVFVDSSALKAIYDAKDDHHAKAEELMRKVEARETEVTGFVTTDYVLDEAVTLTRFAHSHAKAVELADAAMASKFMRVVYSDEGLFADAIRIFKNHPDKEWSLTDCLSFATMHEHEVRTAFAFDAHFMQAGFATLP